MQRMIALLLLGATILSACTSGSSDPTPQQSGNGAAIGSALDWDHSPDTVIVRIDTTGRSGSIANDLNTLPFCVLFGDGHVLWTDPFSDPEKMLEDRIDDQTMREFLNYIIGTGFYSWDDSGDLLIPATEEPDTTPILERITVHLYGETHVINSLANWPPDAFDSILQRCQTLSSTPVLYVPAAAWVSAVPTDIRYDVPSIPWETFASSLSEVDLSTMTLENPVWATGDLVAVAWDLARRGRLQVTQNGSAYRIVVQVPGIQPNAPPTPEHDGS